MFSIYSRLVDTFSSLSHLQKRSKTLKNDVSFALKLEEERKQGISARTVQSFQDFALHHALKIITLKIKKHLVNIYNTFLESFYVKTGLKAFKHLE